MDIYIYTSGPPLFPAPPGASAQPKTGTAGDSTPRPAPRLIGPAPAAVLIGHGQNGAVRLPHTDQAIRNLKPALFRGPIR